MNLENQVSSLELSKKIKELGVKQESYFWWVNQPNGGLRINGYKWQLESEPRTRHQSYDYISAFTVAELGGILPRGIVSIKIVNGWETIYNNTDVMPFIQKNCIADTEADARAKMVIYLLEHKLIQL